MLPVLRFAAAIAIAAFCGVVAADDVERTGGPYVPTPQAVVDAMLDLAKVGARDVVVDLGSGDGRIVLTAAQRYNARGIGFDIDPELVEKSNAEAQKRGVANRVRFVREDVLKAKIDEATVLTLYLLPGMMQSLQAKLVRELKPGTRIVSHDFSFGDWKPDREVSVDVAEKYGTPGQWKSTLFYWVVPARVGGRWRVSSDAFDALALDLKQQYQTLQGAGISAGKSVALEGGRIEGDRVSFKVVTPTGASEYRGTIEGERMRGETVQGSRSVTWTATRIGLPDAP
jgi:SAM-dependent methyltransferase